MATKLRKSIKNEEPVRQLALIRGDMSSDLLSALRHLRQTMADIPQEEWKHRKKRWEETTAHIDGHGLVRNDYN